VMDRTLAGIKKALKPGGCYVSELYTKEQLQYGTGGPRVEEMLCNPIKMLEQFDGYFVKHFHIGEVNRVEGQLHTGTAHVVQSMFQKREEEQYMNGQNRADVTPGLKVAVILKKDQRSGSKTEGVVKDLLTNSSFHPHGIKVRLE